MILLLLHFEKGADIDRLAAISCCHICWARTVTMRFTINVIKLDRCWIRLLILVGLILHHFTKVTLSLLFFASLLL